ncbi:uncharacterized protein LOC126903300 isoform X2 [Daktulosphaira vitifoliae]|uniref:uncharacterized protein LOC126903300 isoform X2 n=1 Tax=Daktulosphaira vitifoliae TaxID=58002 RepID=UPI0021AA5AC1|nr:uncharacterized protein LOC126903300 isoform X2 [Daktulosphaira vitifoliae]
MNLPYLFFSIISFIALSVSQKASPKFLGCYIEDNLVSLGEESHVLTSISPKSCAELCHGKSYLFANIKVDTCHCSKHYISRLMRQYDHECKQKCSGDLTASCGGPPNFVSAYITDSSINSGLVSRGSYPIAMYLGCFAENANDEENRLLKNPIGPNNHNTPQKCSEICFKKGYVYAGVTYGLECWCGNQRPSKTSVVENSNCDVRCSGDKNQFCGGGWKIGIYATGLTEYVANNYIGCFEEEQKKNKTKLLIFQMGTNNSPKRCMNLCNSQTFKYALLKGDVCECQKAAVNNRLKRDQNFCSTSCVEDPSEYCGGNNGYSVYKTLYNDHTGGVGVHAIGCFQNSRRHPIMDGWRITVPNLTPKYCVYSCYARRFPYAALVSGRECMCSFKRPLEESRAESESACHTPCSGARDQKCGGNNVINVYHTGLKWETTVMSNHYIGCYEESADNRIFNGYSKSFPVNTPSFCTKLCFKKGFKYAGVTYKSECFCGDQPPNESTFSKVEDNQCNTKCSGDANQFCGGGWRMGVFTTGLKDLDIENRDVGCFILDENGLNTHTVKYEFVNTNSPSRCSGLCKEVGYRYAGVAKFNCYCTNRIPANDNAVDDSECGNMCSGDNSQTCGDSDRIKFLKLTNEPNLDNRDTNTILEEFDNLNLESLWNYEIYMAGNNAPDYEFVIYNNSINNIFIQNGELIIRPTLLNDSVIKRGSISLNGCTKVLESDQCTKTASSYNILPPVISGKLTTRNSFSFLYGKVEVKASFPSGDWIVPEIALVSKSNEQLKIVIASIAGNTNLRCNNIDESSNVLNFGIKAGNENAQINTKLLRLSSGTSWSNSYHTYTINWTPDIMEFEIDGNKQVLDLSYLPLDILHESEFYISIGVSVGGMVRFPNNCQSNSHAKPWKNDDIKALINFWRDNTYWFPTWNHEKSVLRVQSLQFTPWINPN